jgi:hypothetical protein
MILMAMLVLSANVVSGKKFLVKVCLLRMQELWKDSFIFIIKKTCQVVYQKSNSKYFAQTNNNSK